MTLDPLTNDDAETASCCDKHAARAMTHRILRLGPHSPPIKEQKQGPVTVWKLPLTFSQSKLAGRTQTSNACTIIALKIAENVIKGSIVDVDPAESPERIIIAIANGILDGNAIHARECDQRKLGPGNQNFTIPSAIQADGEEFAEMDFCVQKGEMFPALYKHVLKAVVFWEKLPRRMTGGSSSASPGAMPLCDQAAIAEKGTHRNQLLLLVVANERTILMVYFPAPADKFVVIDSHTHGPCGAVVGMANTGNLHALCNWVSSYLFADHMSLDTGFEISLIVHKSHSNYTQAWERMKKANAKLCSL